MAIVVNKVLCTGCRDCLKVCPAEAIKIANNVAVVSEECLECELCIEECHNEALSFNLVY